MGAVSIRNALLAVLCGWTCEAGAADFRVCIGEIENNCPVAHNSMFGCGTSFDQAAAVICAITVDGKKKISPYRVVPQGTHDGNRCGYSWGIIQCLDSVPSPG
jgi:hypothetical protein